MGHYGAYRDDAREIVRQLRETGRLDDVMNNPMEANHAARNTTQPTMGGHGDAGPPAKCASGKGQAQLEAPERVRGAAHVHCGVLVRAVRAYYPLALAAVLVGFVFLMGIYGGKW